MIRLFLIFPILGLCAFSTGAFAQLSSFVADAVQAAPGQEQRRGKLYVSELGTRFEFTARKQPVIQIVQPSLGLFRLLFPKTKTYFEVKSPVSHLSQGHRTKVPCKSTPRTECIPQGQIKSGKMVFQRWLIRGKGTKTGVRVWWDPVRRMFIRKYFPDGSKMIAQIVGTMQFEGRSVEQWKMTVFSAKGKRLDSYMLFAPDLGFPVMEQGSNGFVKELHNIKTHKQDPELYKIPAGYKKTPFPKK